MNGSGFVQDFPHHTQPLLGWGPIASRAYLATGFVSESELTATVPANLLSTEGTVQVVVVNGDPMGLSDGYLGYPTSNSVGCAFHAS